MIDPEREQVAQESTIRRTARAVAGCIVGLLAGLAISMAIAVAREVIDEVYIHSLGGLISWMALPIVVVPVLGVWAALTRRFQHFWTAMAGAVVGIAGGAVLGAAVGGLAGDVSSAPWAGGLIGAGAGALLGILAGATLGPRDPQHRLGPGSAAIASVGAAAAVAILLRGSFSTEPPPAPAETSAAEPSPEQVESLLVLVGDPGSPPDVRYPVLAAAEDDIERWSRQLSSANAGADTSSVPDTSSVSPVTVIVLGDVVYPDGLHPADHPSRAQDSLTILSQIDLVDGEAARAARTRMMFTPGNHDWGQEEDWAGAVRVHRLDDFLQNLDLPPGTRAGVAPRPGTGGPEVVDMGAHLRLLLLDTAWWLLEGEEARKAAVMEGVSEAFRTAGNRRIAIAAHHPFATGGPHGASPDAQRTLGLRYLLTRAGTILQDLSSAPYRDLRDQLLAISREHGAPALYLGGHEHSLQVFRHPEPPHPAMSVVSGSASKLTQVRDAQDMVMGESAPGYVKLFVLNDGTLQLHVEGTAPEFVTCPREDESGPPTVSELGADADAQTAAEGAVQSTAGPGEESESECMREALAGFRTLWAGRVLPDRPRDLTRRQDGGS